MMRKPIKLFSPKQPTRIACWNVRTMYQSEKSAQIAKEMDRYNIEILGLSEVRWNTSGMTTISTGHTIIYSGNPNKGDPHEKGVGFLLNKTSKKSLLEWNPISPRIATARFDTKFQKTTSTYSNKRGTRDRKRRFLQCTTICRGQNTKTGHPYHHG